MTLAFTMGDPGGIGPEVALKAMRRLRSRRDCRALLIGSRKVFSAAGWRSGTPLLDVGSEGGVARRPSAQGGRASYAAVREALSLAARGLVDAVVTAPISKESWAMAGLPYRDHTELLEEATGRRGAMMLMAGNLRTVLVTRHLPLKKVPSAVTALKVRRAAELTVAALKVLGIRRPRLGLCALNPHAGDGGLLGAEEKRLSPAALNLRRSGLEVEGPLAADAAWAAHAAGRYDALLSLYHDQALIPLKLKGGYGVVNWTIGLPVVRTAPGHGTAFDIAGKGVADPSGMIAAALWAAQVASRRRTAVQAQA